MVTLDVRGFATLEIGKKQEPVSIEELQEHRSNRWRPVAIDRRQRHGIGFDVDVLAGFFEPVLELHDRVWVEMPSLEGATDVLPARLIDGSVVSHEGLVGRCAEGVSIA